MPKLGMEPLRRKDLVNATIAEVGAAGSLSVTVGQIARRAGMSPALAHHYFGSKDQIFLAAMRHILTVYGAEVRSALKHAGSDSQARLTGLIGANFSDINFQPAVVSAWLNFYVLARTSPWAARLLAVYQRRLRSNLIHDLRPLVGPRAPAVADTLSALIDGLYIRAALGTGPSPQAAIACVRDTLDLYLNPQRPPV